MYNLPYHKAQNEAEIKAFIRKYPFAFLAGCAENNRPVVTQVPVFIEEKNGQKILRGHIMKNSDHHKAFMHNENVLVVFSGKHCYVSATWYSNPHLASTWNYMSVQIHGTIKILGEDALEEILQLTSLHFENDNQSSPTVFNNLPATFKQRTMNAIVTFEIEITEMDSVFKLSQDRDFESYCNIIERLKGKGEDGQEIAAEMEKRIRQVFPEK